MTEEWRPIVGYEKYYEVSNFGRVRSLDRMIKNAHGTPNSRIRYGKILTPQKNWRGYMCVDLRGDHKKQIAIHRLVAITFIPNTQNLKVVNHKDGIKTNNNMVNLEWTTYSGNMIHAFENGLCSRQGPRVSVIDQGVILRIRKTHRSGTKIKKIIKDFNISVTTLYRIINKTDHYKNI